MADAKHSPGPWKSHPIEKSHGLPYVPVAAETLIARVYSKHFGDDEQAAANGHLIAAAPELLEALIWREQFEPRAGEGDSERFDRIAETFHRETGHMRPGKDCRVEPIEVRQQAWDDWMEEGRARVRAAIAIAIGVAA